MVDRLKSNFHIVSDGKIERKENTIYFTNELVKRAIPIDNIQQISCHGSVSVTSQALHILAKKGVVLHFFNYFNFYDGSFYPRETLLSGNLLVKQVEHYLDNEKRMDIAKLFISGAIDNMRRTIAEYKISGKNEELLGYKTEITTTSNITELLNVEARARIAYYDCFDTILSGDLKYDKRTRNPPKNEINALISFGNSLLYSSILCEIYNTQLNPTISYLHEPGERRFSLCLDLSELFKPLLVDRLIFYVINKKILSASDFRKDLNGVVLTENGRKKFLKYYEEKLSMTIKHRSLRRNVSYLRLIRLEAYKLIKHLVSAKQYKPFVMWW